MEVLHLMLFCVFVTSVPSIVGYIDLRADPKVISLTSTDSLTLTCTYKYTGTSAIKNVTYLSISKETGPDELKTLAAIEKQPGDSTMGTRWIRDNAYGHFDKGSTSSLTVRFKGPAFQRDEKFACDVKGLDENGDIFQSEESVEVKLKYAQRSLDAEKIFYAPKVYNDAMYYLSRVSVDNIALAINYCNNLGGYLIEVDDEDEVKMAEKLSRFHEKRYVFIAGTDQEVEGHWIFPRTGQNVTYFNWFTTRPNNFEKEDCRIIQYFHFATKLNDIHCLNDWKINFICEVKHE